MADKKRPNNSVRDAAKVLRKSLMLKVKNKNFGVSLRTFKELLETTCGKDM